MSCGAAFLTRASIKASQLSWIKEQELVRSFHSSEFTAKQFCSVCGSNLISTYDHDPERISLPLGGLDQAPNDQVEGHFFVASKAPWFEITDGLPPHETWPGTRVDARKTSDEPWPYPQRPHVHAGPPGWPCGFDTR